MEQIQHRVRVVNRNPFPIKDRHDGVPYFFEPGKPADIPPEVAEHIFGYPGDVEDMHRHMAKRWGWNLPQHYVAGADGLLLWEKQCRNISVSVERYELRRIVDPKAPIPAEEAGEVQPFDTLSLPEAPSRRAVGKRKPKGKGWPKGKKRGPRVQLGGKPGGLVEVPEVTIAVDHPAEA